MVAPSGIRPAVMLENGRAVGVAYRHRGKVERAEAGCVILAGGAINSPQLLMLSGIGPADHLREHGVAVALDRAGVGANLQDHLDICTLVRSTRAVTYDKTNDVAVALRFLLKRDGIGSSNIAEAGGFVRSRLAPDSRCDIQFHFVPALLDDHARDAVQRDRAAAHRARRQGRVDHALAIHLRRVAPRVLERVHLAVQDRAALLHAAVVAAADDASLVHDHRTDRDAAFGEARLRFVDRGLEERIHGP